VLVETGFISEPPNFKQDIFNLQVAGYHPVLAHPERYLYLHDNPAKLHSLVESGIFLQLNVMSLTGYYSPRIKKVAEYLVNNDLVSFIGSDVHNIRHFDIVMQAMKTPVYSKLNHEKLLNYHI
jgi:protein-tyrosine phosphatase